MFRILVADQIAEEGLALLRAHENVQVDVRLGLKPTELAVAIGECDGLLIRSGVSVTAEALAQPGRLRVIARAGVGVDNVDVAAATAAGVLVLNTPDANTIATAEHTMAMMLALARRLPDAHVHVKAGGWERKSYLGKQLQGKTLGIVGLGRVGSAVAQRALSFEMQVAAYDPFLHPGTALDGRVQVVASLDEMLERADILTLHASLSADSRNLIGPAQLARMKRTAWLINCARGSLVDEPALAEALNRGMIAGAAVDVFSKEPPEGNPLLAARNIILTPHLGASTEEAQTAVSTEAVRSLLDFLCHGTIRGAVNVTGLPTGMSARQRACLDLAGRMGAILSPLASGGIDRVIVTTYAGSDYAAIGESLGLCAAAEIMSPHVEGRLNLVNASAFARARGLDIQHATRTAARELQETMSVRIEKGGESHFVEGAVFLDGRPRILSIDGYRMEMVPEGRLLMIYNDDRPGVIGLVGTLFGDMQINIADMFLSRRDKTALMCLRIDGPVSSELIDRLRAAEPILSVQSVRLDALPPQGV